MQSNFEYQLPLEVPGLKAFQSNQKFMLEAGGHFPGITIAYHTYGSLNADKSNVIWVCHALTANSKVDDWWQGLFGAGKLFDPGKYFVVCANVLGSCYGTTGPRSMNDATGEPYGVDFPLITIRDQVKALQLLFDYLNISRISLCIGGSCGGHQAMEFAYVMGDQIKNLALLVTSATETAWAIAGHAAQRMAIKADPTFVENQNMSGENGMRAARAMALLNYRTFQNYVDRQTDIGDLLEGFRASSYVTYQGDKLAKRFYPHSYYHLTRTLDTHDIGRNRGSAEEALAKLSQDTLVIGMNSDKLIPPSEQKFLAEHIPNGKYAEVFSTYGHDGFLVETQQINKIVREHFWQEAK